MRAKKAASVGAVVVVVASGLSVCAATPLVGAAAPAVAAAPVSAAAPAVAAAPVSAATAPGSYTLVSAPDFLNADTADVSDSPYWQPGDPNSTNADYEAALDTVLDDVAQWTPKSVLLDGDAVEGHWGKDTLATGIFGPVRTEAEQLRAVRLAASQYYSADVERFAEHGLPLPHAAIGDHEIGDNPWKGNAYNDFKRRNVSTFKNAWSRWFTGGGTRYGRHPSGTSFDRTAYAVMLAPEIELITVDMFRRTSTDVVNELGGGELRWFRQQLADANARGVDWILVQGHDPVLGPVRARSSSRQVYRGGPASAFWRAMKDARVDLYLNGEVHDTTAIQQDGITQVSHGGLFYKGEFSYLVAQFSGSTVELQTREFSATTDSTSFLWQTDRQNQPAGLQYTPGSYVSGTLTLDKDQHLLERSGLLDVYVPPAAAPGPGADLLSAGRAAGPPARR